MDHLGVSAKAATCDAVSSPTRNAPVKQPNCNPALFSHHFGRSSESPRFNNGTASANEDVCKNGCVSKEQQVCFFLRDGNKISLGQQHLKQPGCWISLPHGYTVIHHKNTVEYRQQIDEHGYVMLCHAMSHLKKPFVSWIFHLRGSSIVGILHHLLEHGNVCRIVLSKSPRFSKAAVTLWIEYVG